VWSVPDSKHASYAMRTQSAAACLLWALPPFYRTGLKHIDATAALLLVRLHTDTSVMRDRARRTRTLIVCDVELYDVLYD
jgi:hypothetical protein